jgi:glutathione S-transferase
MTFGKLNRPRLEYRAAREIALKLYHSPTSPYVRKCMISAHELGIVSRLTLVPAAPHPVNRDPNVVASNPLGKVPTLVTDEGTVLYDSRVICEYFDCLAGGGLIPAAGPARWSVLVEQALADGILDAAVLTRYETAVRPEPLRWTDWTRGQLDKVNGGLDELERRAEGWGTRVDLGTVAIACALGYIEFRYPELEWRRRAPRASVWFAAFRERASMRATEPPAN